MMAMAFDNATNYPHERIASTVKRSQAVMCIPALVPAWAIFS